MRVITYKQFNHVEIIAPFRGKQYFFGIGRVIIYEDGKENKEQSCCYVSTYPGRKNVYHRAFTKKVSEFVPSDPATRGVYLTHLAIFILRRYFAMSGVSHT